MEKISLILLGLIFIDFLLLLKKSRNLINKIFHTKIIERKPIADNLMIGLITGFTVYSLNKGDFMIILSACFILSFMILRGFEYRKLR